MLKRILKTSLLTVLVFACVIPVQAKTKHHEKYYQDMWCIQNDGIQEFKVKGESVRIDCQTQEYSLEVDFAKKFYEAIGQSLYYSILTDKKPAVLLILEKKSDEIYLKRLNTVSDKYGIKVYTIKNY